MVAYLVSKTTPESKELILLRKKKENSQKWFLMGKVKK